MKAVNYILFSIFLCISILIKANCGFGSDYKHCDYWMIVYKNGTYSLQTSDGSKDVGLKEDAKKNKICPKCSHSPFDHVYDGSGFPAGPRYET